MEQGDPRIGMIGYGAMGRSLAANLAASSPPIPIGAVLQRAGSIRPTPAGLPSFDNIADFIAWKPALVVECAGHSAVRNEVPALLRAGIKVIVMSIGALADSATFAALRAGSTASGARMIAATGAIGGIDALKSARCAALSRVTYIGRKPPAAWAGTPGAKVVQLDSLSAPATIFEGDAAAAALSYPKNANVTAAVALAGVGFERTRVRLVADPTITRNVHEIEATGAFGNMLVRLENEPLPENPRTSRLAVLNAEHLIRRELDPIEI